MTTTGMTKVAMNTTEESINAPKSKSAEATSVAAVKREPGAGVYYAIQHMIEMMRTFWKFHKMEPPRS